MFNIPEYTVSEFSRSIKRVVEDAFGYVKIKGEISGFKKATSGHLYFTLKDEKAVISAVCFRNVAQFTKFELEDGLQVVASGKVTTFEGRSNYQIIVEKIELAGVGAILEMIEKRRLKLAAEGLFDDAHKKPIPFFPKIIGIITSPTGAVIEDIKHRINDRCPSHLIIYPSLVQGEKASAQVIQGLNFFNQMQENRPEVIIIARGGGSIEDLLCFNDEMLVREVFKSEIPVISAIGHETDTTLIDYVADVRAPTPTAAAEFVTVVLSDLKNRLKFLEERLEFLPKNFFIEKENYLKNLQKYIIDPATKIKQIKERLELFEKRFLLSVKNILIKKNEKLNVLQLSKPLILQRFSFFEQKINLNFKRINLGLKNSLEIKNNQLQTVEKLLKSTHYKEVLKRGFAFLRNQKGDLILSVSDVKPNDEVTIELSDGKINAKINA